MSKSSKIMIGVIASVLAVCILTVAIVSSVLKKNNETANPSETSENGVSQTTTLPQTSILLTDILGKWTDSSKMMAYDFHDNGTVDATYVNLVVPVINLPINGSALGTYTLEGDKLDIHVSIYSKTIDVKYTAKIENGNLVLKDREDGDVTTLMREASEPSSQTETSKTEPITEITPVPDTIIGDWLSSDEAVKYSFFEDGKMNVEFSNSEITMKYSGVYMQNDGNLIVRYTANEKKVTRDFKMIISGTTMSLTNSNDDTTLFTKVVDRGRLLLGKWKDSSGMSGFEFKENGVADVTYVNLTVPVINLPINGTFTGSYSLNGNKVTVSYSIYSSSISETYIYNISGNTLTLTSTDDGDVSTYIKR